MRRPSRDATMALAYVALSCALALLQRPGRATSDTKIDLHVDPAPLRRPRSPRSGRRAPTSARSRARQYSGYLWPMGPFFAALRRDRLLALGGPPAVARAADLRAVGLGRRCGCMDALVGRPRGVAHAVAAAFYVAQPVHRVFTGRTSVDPARLRRAALAAARRPPRRARHSGAGAGAPAGGGRRCSRSWSPRPGGGINGGGGGLDAGRAARPARLRAARRRGALARRPRLPAAHRRPGHARLAVVDRPAARARRATASTSSSSPSSRGTIWAHEHAAEALRLMAYWTSYIGLGFYGTTRPFFSEAGTLLFNPLVVGASLLVPALALAGFAWTRRWRYGPFFLLLLLVGVVDRGRRLPGRDAGPRTRWSGSTSNVSVLRFMRTTQKAGAARRDGRRRAARPRRPARLGAPARAARPARGRGRAGRGAAGLRGPDRRWPRCRSCAGPPSTRQLTWDRIPAAWTQAGHGPRPRRCRRNTRAHGPAGPDLRLLQLGRHGRLDPAARSPTARWPCATRRPTPTRTPPTCSRRSTAWSSSSASTRASSAAAAAHGRRGGRQRHRRRHRAQRRGRPRARPPRRSPARASTRPSRSYGPSARSAGAAATSGRAAARARRSAATTCRPGAGSSTSSPPGPPTSSTAPPRAWPRWPPSAPCPPTGRSSTRATCAPTSCSSEAAGGRRRRRHATPTAAGRSCPSSPSRTSARRWRRPTAQRELGPDRPVPRPRRRRPDRRRPPGRALRAPRPREGGLLEFPEHTPSTAFDGDPRTRVGRRPLPPGRDRWIEIGFDTPRDVPYVDLLADPRSLRHRARGRRQRRPREARPRHHARAARPARRPPRPRDAHEGRPAPRRPARLGRLPRDRASRACASAELLRTPLVAGRALAGATCRATGLTYLFERDTADAPFRRNRRIGSPLLERPQDREDPEQVIDRALFAPADAPLRASTPGSRSPPTRPTPRSTASSGLRGGETFTSSDRFGGRPPTAPRAPSTGGPTPPGSASGRPRRPPRRGSRGPAPRPQTLSTLRLRPAQSPVRRPTVVRVSWPGGRTGPCASAPTAPSPSRGPSAPAPSASPSCRPRSRRGSRPASAPCAPWASAPSRRPGSPRSPCRAAGRCARSAAASRPTSAAAGSRCGRRAPWPTARAGARCARAAATARSR